jgi:RHH-type proline utilization regulon transcriptional repressor/proline dehydrogenase/delta 1-pyrroline-5-carboxylate dehydrogenase
VKWGVQLGSYTHCTEFFGPVLGVMKANNIHEAIDSVNQTGYGLTSGIESLDNRELEIWRDSIRAGNLYINRGTTGAIVLRQPFGGMGKSAFGPGIKAGGPNYVAQLMHFRETGNAPGVDTISDPALAQLWQDFKTAASDHKAPMESMDASRLHSAIASYQKYYEEEFAVEHDHFKLVGQDNFRRYLPVRELRIRVHSDDTPFEIVARACAAKIVGCRVTVSTRPEANNPTVAWLDEVTESWAGAIEFIEESDDEFAQAILDGQTLRARYADRSRVSTVIRQAAAETGLFIADEPVLGHGRLELLWYVEEQSISDNYHRYGNLGERSNEIRAEVL